MILRRWISRVSERYLSWATDPISSFFETLVGPLSEAYNDIAAETGATPSTLEWGIATGFGLLYIALVIVLIWAFLQLLSPAIQPLIEKGVGREYTKGTQTKLAVGVWAVLVAIDSILTREIYVIELVERVATYLAVLRSMPDAGIDVGVDAFTWGFMESATLEFALVIVVLTFMLTAFAWYALGLPQVSLIAFPFITLSLLAIGYVGTDLLGYDVFPLPIWVAFVILALILGFVVMTPIVWVLDRGIYHVLDFIPWTQVREPVGKYAAFDAWLFLLIFALFVDPLLSLLVWISYKVQRHGGMKRGVMKLVGRQQECDINPETGQEECQWVTR